VRLKLLFLSFLSLASLGPLNAQSDEAAPEAGTARDIILRADNAYNAKKYGEAIAGYKKFLGDFGSAAEAAPFLPHVRYNLSAALMQEQKFGEAAEEIGEALKLEDLSTKQKEDLSFWLGVALLQAGDPEQAVKVIGEFRTAYPQSTRVRDAELLTGTGLLASGKNAEAAKVFASIRKLPKHPHRGRAAVL